MGHVPTLPCQIQKIIEADTFNCCPMPPCSRSPPHLSSAVFPPKALHTWYYTHY